MRAFSCAGLGALALGLFLTACEGNGEVISGGGTAGSIGVVETTSV